jgi:microcystin-dependent protein
MGLLENLNSGKYNLVLFSILFIFIFHQYWDSSKFARFMRRSQCKETKETMSNVSNDIKEAVKQVYLADVEAIRNLSDIANKINAGTFVFPGNLTVTGSFNYLPRGTIVAYNSTSAPSGWTLCDGSNSSPDLRNRFILGWGNRGVGTTGGEENVTLNEGQMPHHSHSVTSRGDINLYNYASQMLHYTNQRWDIPTVDRGRAPAKYGEISVYGDTNAKGGNQPHNNMPPFYVLTYIMKL